MFPRLSFFISKHYRPKLEKSAFVFNDSTIRYREQEYNPVVIHFPGGKKNKTWLNELTESLDRSSTIPQKTPENIHIIQINNYLNEDKEINPGEYFLKKAGIHYYCDKKKSLAEEWKNSNKILLLHELLQQIPTTQIPQYFLFFDSSDAILIDCPSRLIEALEHYQCKILFGMDTIIHNGHSWQRNTIHTPDYIHEYRKQRYRFLNSGMIFGEADFMRGVLSSMIEEYQAQFPHQSDQHYYHECRFNYLSDIEVDYQKQYLLNIFPFKSFFERYQV